MDKVKWVYEWNSNSGHLGTVCTGRPSGMGGQLMHKHLIGIFAALVLGVSASPKGGAMTKPIPLDGFRVPPGQVGATLDLHGCWPVTALVEAARLEEVLAAVERCFGLDPADRGSTRTHCRLRGQLRARLRRTQRGPRKGQSGRLPPGLHKA